MKWIFAFALVFGVFLGGCPQEGPSGNGGQVVAPPQEFCTDSDGGKNEFAAGTVSSHSGTFADRCLGNGEMVLEYYCDGNRVASENIACPPGHKCYSGECREIPCSDSDGGRVYGVAGTVLYDGEQHTDTCIDENTLREFYCDNGVAEEIVQCGAGKKCQDGRCVEAPVCIDSDGGQDIYSKGTVTYGGATYEDVCLSHNVVYEYYCEGGAVAVKQIMCPEGEACEGGKCVEAFVGECEDTDGGKNPYKKGTVTYWAGGQEHTVVDKCYDTYSVLEAWCTDDGLVGIGIIECDSGDWCENGRCIGK